MGKKQKTEEEISWLEKLHYKNHIDQTGSCTSIPTECSSDDRTPSGKVKHMMTNHDEIFLKVDLLLLNFLINAFSFLSNLIPPNY